MTSLVSLARMPSLFSFLPADIPGVPCSTMKAEMPRCPFVRSVTAMTTMTPPILPWVMNVLAPLITHALALTHGSRAHAGRVAAGAGFGQAPCAPHLAADEPRQVLLLLLAATEHRDVGRAQTVVRRDGERHRGTDAGQLFDADAVVDRRERGAAVFFGKLHAGKTERGEFRQEIVRELLRLVPLHDVGTDLGFRELADRPAQQVLLLSRAKVH